MRLYCFATTGSKYVDLAYQCQALFSEYIPVEVVEIPDRNDWMARIFERAYAFQKLAKSHPDEACGWIDADLFPLQSPDAIINWDQISENFDIALTLRLDHTQHFNKICAGIVLFAPYNKCKVIDNIVHKMRDDPRPCEPCREQIYIAECIQKLKVFDLGSKYNSPDLTDAIIYHSHAANKDQYINGR